MIRSIVCLCLALYACLAFLGADHGQKRMGLTGAYQAHALAAATAEGALPVAPAPKAPSVKAAAAIPAAPVAAAAPTPAITATLSAATRAAAPAHAEVSLADIRRVLVKSVNIRRGPSVDEKVLDRLGRDEEVLVVGEAGDGWLHVRIEGDGIDGFVLGEFLSTPGA